MTDERGKRGKRRERGEEGSGPFSPLVAGVWLGLHDMVRILM